MWFCRLFRGLFCDLIWVVCFGCCGWICLESICLVFELLVDVGVVSVVVCFGGLFLGLFGSVICLV